MPAWIIGLFAGKISKYVGALVAAFKKKEYEVLMPIVAKIVAEVDADPTVTTAPERFKAVMDRALAVFLSKQLSVAYYMVVLAASLAVNELVLSQAGMLTSGPRGSAKSRWSV
jgi:hypothetical protein